MVIAKPEGVGRAERLAAAERAVLEVRDGMALGFGSGRAAGHVLEALARRSAEEGLRVSGVPSSKATETKARALGLTVTSLDEHPVLDLTIDGADEVDPTGQLIKGAGGALLREKVLAAASERLVIVVEGMKLVPHLGATRRVPVEVLPFAWNACVRHIRDLGGDPALRRTGEGQTAISDNGNWVLDCAFPREVLGDGTALDARLHAIPGVLETGLFVQFRPTVYAGFPSEVRVVDFRSA